VLLWGDKLGVEAPWETPELCPGCPSWGSQEEEEGEDGMGQHVTRPPPNTLGTSGTRKRALRVQVALRHACLAFSNESWEQDGAALKVTAWLPPRAAPMAGAQAATAEQVTSSPCTGSLTTS